MRLRHRWPLIPFALGFLVALPLAACTTSLTGDTPTLAPTTTTTAAREAGELGPTETGGATPAAAGVDGSETPSAEGVLEVYYFDVGQGDATLLVGADFTILIDAGRHDRNDVVEHLVSADVIDIDLLVGTHPHADHIGQIPHVLVAFPVREVWLSGDVATSQTFERVLDAIEGSDDVPSSPSSALFLPLALRDG